MKRENFGSRTAVIFALAGSAIGLGNIWRFPYMVGEYGGAAFILVYIIATLVISLPIFMAECIIGRGSGHNALGAVKTLARPKSRWRVLGIISVLTPLIIVSYYGVVGGWSLDFLFKSCGLYFVKTPPEDISGVFGSLISQTWRPILWHTIFLLASITVVAGGVKSGIERFSKIAIPVLFLMIVFITVYSLTLPGAKEGVEYLVKPDWAKLTPKTCAYALGQSFFSLSLGMGIIITYSSYMKREENMLVTGVGTVAADLLFAILSGFAIMPAVFAAGIEPSAGAGLIFQTLPFTFSSMAQTMPVVSSVVAILFFATILVAALTSAVSLLEVGVAWLVEEKGLSRRRACAFIFLFTWLLGILASLSYGPLSGIKILGNVFFDLLDKFSSNFLLTAGACMVVLFVGWRMKKEAVRSEFTNGGIKKKNAACFELLYFLIKYVAPVGVVVIFITNFL